MRASLLAIVIATGCDLGQVQPSGPNGGVPDAPPTTAPTIDAAPAKPDAKALLSTWSGCMSLANFQTANMAQAWGTLTTGSNQQCSNCHGTGAFGMIATTDETLFFKTVSEQTPYLVKFFSADVAGGKVIINTTSFKNAGVTIAGHPRFDPENHQGMTALKAFYDSTVARQVANACDPPRLIN